MSAVAALHATSFDASKNGHNAVKGGVLLIDGRLEPKSRKLNGYHNCIGGNLDQKCCGSQITAGTRR